MITAHPHPVIISKGHYIGRGDDYLHDHSLQLPNKSCIIISVSIFILLIMTFNSTWICILVGCISVFLVGASNLTDYYPPLWKESPGQLSEYRIEDGKYNINPCNYSERLGLYKILVKQTVSDFEKFAPENEHNILWGLAAFHG